MPEAYRRLSPEQQQNVRRILDRLSDELLPSAGSQDFFGALLSAMGDSADPVRCLISFERFFNQFNEKQEIISFLQANPRTIEILTKIFSTSQYLTEVLLKNVHALMPLTGYRLLSRPKSSDQLYGELLAAVSSKESYRAKLNALRMYQSAEILRIGTCDLLDLYDLWAVTRQLSNLADALIRISLKIAADEVDLMPGELCVIGMGKLGGRELNYSSDIDLILVTESDTTAVIPLARKFVDVLDLVTENGFLYRVDLRLRPWGSVGPLLNTIESYQHYLQHSGRLWEKQALLKARVIAGDLAAGESLLEKARPLITAGDPELIRQSVDTMRMQTENQLLRKGIDWGEVKLGMGSIRDVEFTVQYLQMIHGKDFPRILTPNTMETLRRLSEANLLNADENRILSEGYVFQRTVEHFLQIMDYRQTHILPSDPAELDTLARRLGFEGEQPGSSLVERYEQHVHAIRDVYLHLVRDPYSQNHPRLVKNNSTPMPDEMNNHLARMASTYSEIFDPAEIALHAHMAQQLTVENPAQIQAALMPEERWQCTIVAYDFPGEIAIITGLLFVYGMDILDGEAFTYQPLAQNAENVDATRKIVDVFYLSPLPGVKVTPDLWNRYRTDFSGYHRLIRENKRDEVIGELTRRFADRMEHTQTGSGTAVPTLFPIELEIDNDTSPLDTVLRIRGTDTTGFLFELTNALAISGVYIDRVILQTTGTQVEDVLFVTDSHGKKIVDPDRQQELRTAVVLIKHFTHLLPYSPNPESALTHFSGFIEQLFRIPDWPRKLVSVEQPEVLQALARVLGVSDFLWNDFLRMQYSNLFPVVTDLAGLSTPKDRATLYREVQAELTIPEVPAAPDGEEISGVEALTAWRDREMFRIDMRHILGITPEFWDFATELNQLSEVVIDTLFQACYRSLAARYGTPHREDDSLNSLCVAALGKFGGGEMGYGSDIELIFVYDRNGFTSGQGGISTAEFYEKLVELFARSLRARREGIFQLDLQLRPYGKNGNLAVSLDAFRRYYAPGGPAWSYERQALIRLRPVAGDAALGKQLEELRDAFLYTGQPFDAISMWAMRERQLRHLVQPDVFNLKYSLGGLVDLEYLVQGLQIQYGAQIPSLRQTNTRAAMANLAEAGILTEEDYTHLRKAHTFLRWMIDSLRVVRGNAKDVTVPSEGSDELAFLARRMRYGDNPSALLRDLHTHQVFVQEANKRLLK